MGGLLREALLRENVFLISLPLPTQPTFHLFSCIPHPFPSLPPFFMSLIILSPPSDDPWLPHANERRCCGFNANQYCANIHLRRRLHGARETLPTWNAKSSMLCVFWALSWKCTCIHAVQHAHHPSLKMPRKINQQRNRGWDGKNKSDNNWEDQTVEGVGCF